MTSDAGHPTATAARPVTPVPPSRFVKIVMGPMTRVLNPLTLKLAGRPHFHLAAQLTHTGRRSGRTYVTPVGARRAGDMVLIPLTFGNQSDWSRNVLAEEADQHVRDAFGRLERAGLGMLGIRQFLRLSVAPAGS
jgi:hypothetical protein